jgi:hypothetical protein
LTVRADFCGGHPVVLTVRSELHPAAVGPHQVEPVVGRHQEGVIGLDLVERDKLKLPVLVHPYGREVVRINLDRLTGRLVGDDVTGRFKLNADGTLVAGDDQGLGVGINLDAGSEIIGRLNGDVTVLIGDQRVLGSGRGEFSPGQFPVIGRTQIDLPDWPSFCEPLSESWPWLWPCWLWLWEPSPCCWSPLAWS